MNKSKPPISSKNQVNEYELAMLNKANKNIQSQLDEIVAQRDLVVNSVSFKIGSFLTLPFRKILDVFRNKKKEKINPIKASIDGVFISNDLIEIHGWALSDSKIIKIEIFLNNVNSKSVELGLFRADVMQAFPEIEYSQFSGFSALLKGCLSDELLIKITDDENNIVELEKTIIPAVGDMSLNAQYKIFLEQHNNCKEEQINSLINTTFAYQPLISIIVPVYNVEPQWLDLCIGSIIKQIYPNWQLCLYDDCSNKHETITCLQKWQNVDSRINIAFGKANKGIALASNQAIKLAKGQFVALLDDGDELTHDALLQVVAVLNQNNGLDFIYSDEDKINGDGELCDPHFKSDFNRAALLSWNYICHFSVIRKSLGDSIQWFRAGFDGAQDYDLFLRLVSKTNEVHHIPRVLYHWRKTVGNTAVSSDNKIHAFDTSKKALIACSKEQNSTTTVKTGLFENSFYLKREITTLTKVSIIIPFKNQFELTKNCLESLLNKTSYKNYEVILVNNQSDDLELLAYIKSVADNNNEVKLIHYDEAFNFASLNNWAVKQVDSELILFLNNDIEVINEDWLEAMIAEIQADDMAAVGAKLLFDDNTIQHAGIVVSAIGAVHINKGLPDGENGYFQRANYVQHVSACTAACLLVKKSIFIEVGGFDEELFAIAYNDVDLCLKMRQAGYLITYTPYAKLYHYESKSRGYDDSPEKIERFTQELKNYQQKWGTVYKNSDPFYNPNLKQTSEKIYLNID